MRSWLVPILLVGLSMGYYLHGTDNSYITFPKWNACVNASISFDFKVINVKKETLLMYTDDGGNFDFMQV